MAPPFRAEHVGSLIRPDELLAVHANAPKTTSGFTFGQEETISEVEREAIVAAVRTQVELNIRPITSGEYERHIFYSGLFEKVPGFSIKDLPISNAFRTNFPTTTELHRKGVHLRAAAVCTGKIRYDSSPYLAEWMHLRSQLPESQWKECKLTVPSPTWHHMQLADSTAYDPSVYSSPSAYFADLAAVYAAEFQTLYDAGLRSIQIDDPNLTFFLSPSFLSGCAADGIEPTALLNLYISAHNACLRSRPADLHVGIHLCRGNFGDIYFAEGSYEQIAEKIFTQLDYDTFYLEYDSPRAGSFSPLRFLPRGKNVVLGVVSTKTVKLEDKADLKVRVQQAADVIANAQGRSMEDVMDNLGVSPQCGFSSSSLGGSSGMTMEIMWKKLELVRDLARDIWADAV